MERAQGGTRGARSALSCLGAALGHGSGHHGLLLPVERVLAADRDQARPVGRARHWVHEPLADGLDTRAGAWPTEGVSQLEPLTRECLEKDKKRNVSMAR